MSGRQLCLFLAAVTLRYASAGACTEYTSHMGNAQAARGDCGTIDDADRWSGVARLCTHLDGPDGDLCTGCTTTFIEDDVIASEAHCLGMGPEVLCCDNAGADGTNAVCTTASAQDLSERHVVWQKRDFDLGQKSF